MVDEQEDALPETKVQSPTANDSAEIETFLNNRVAGSSAPAVAGPSGLATIRKPAAVPVSVNNHIHDVQKLKQELQDIKDQVSDIYLPYYKINPTNATFLILFFVSFADNVPGVFGSY